MATHDFETWSAEKASTTDEIESSSRRSTTDDFGGDSDYGDDSVSGTDSNDENEKSKTSTLRERRKYMDTAQHCTKTNAAQSDTETKNLLDDMGEEIDDDFLNLNELNCDGRRNGSLELDEKLFELSDEQLNYYTNCFLFLMHKSQGFVSLQGALQGNDRIVLEFFRKSSLDDLTLSKIWSLSDANEDGFLNLAEFISAMHLIVLHTKGSVPIPDRLPPSVRPPVTPIRTSVHAQDEFAGSLSNHSLSNSSAKYTAECLSSNSANSQLPCGDRMPKCQNGEKHSLGQHQTINGKQHSLSDDHLNSQRPTTIAKFSDVPPLLVDGHPMALNVPLPTSQIMPQFARLFVSTARGPPPLPPFRAYTNNTTGCGTKGHGRSVSLDLKTFSALSSNFDSQSTPPKDEIDSGRKDCQSTESPARSTIDKPSQTFHNTNTVGTQTIVDCSEDYCTSLRIKLETEQITPNERCQILQRINEQLEEERTKLKQVRLQIQLRVDETQRKLREISQNSTNKKVQKPTIL